MNELTISATTECYKGRGVVGINLLSAEKRRELGYKGTLLAVMHKWMTQSLPRQALQASLCVEESRELIDAGRWPGARLYQLTLATESAGIMWPLKPVDYTDRYHACAVWALDVCVDYLVNRKATGLEMEAVHFLLTDRIEGSTETFMDLWEKAQWAGYKRSRAFMEDAMSWNSIATH